MKTNNNKLFKIEEIPNCNYLMTVPILKEYGEYIFRQGGSVYFKEVMWIVKNSISLLYYERNSFDKGVKFLLEKVINKPRWAEKVNNGIVNHTKKYFAYAKSGEKVDFTKLNDKELVKSFEHLIELQRRSHNSGQITTWLIDAEHSLFSNFIIRTLEEKIKLKKSNLNLVKSFSLLTTPEKPSWMEKESSEFLKIALQFQNDKKAPDFIKKNTTVYITDNLDRLDRGLKNLLINHHKKYLWLHYTYEGPALGLDYFVDILRGLIKEKNLKSLIKESENNFFTIKKDRNNIFNILNFNKKERDLFNIAKDIVWLKGWRKDCMYFGSYVLDKIAKEIARRLNLSLKQVRYFCDWEVREAMLKGKFNINILNERPVFSVIYSKSDGKPVVLSGSKGKKFLKKFNFEDDKVIDINELRGMTAYPGKVRGAVKIVETVDDIKKMKKGDILLSETTYPALVPAMKLAGAIVTNAGGITCHAAIVSRELKIPCVVGTKIATKVLRDGDIIEVDAEKGIVKILK